MSQTPAAARHSAVLLASLGQVAPEPVQFSAGSQTPAEARHSVLDGWKASAGQVTLEPSQLSATSQTPADGRQTVVDGWTASAGQAAPEPSQLSATSQAPADGRQMVVAGSTASAGQLAPEPVQLSATSQGPADGRQVVVLAWKPSAGQVTFEPSAPVEGGQGLLLLRDRTPDSRDLLLWKWRKGAATAKEEFGTPDADTDYAFCIYRGTTPQLVLGEVIQSGPQWTATRTGYRYRDVASGRLFRITLKEGLIPGATQITVKQKGGSLVMPSLVSLTSPLTVQLKNLDTNLCWEASYSFPPAMRHDADQFKDRPD